MSIEELARSAVEVVAGRLAQRGTRAAGQVTDAAVDGVYQLIAQRLQGSATGQHVLDLLRRSPADQQSRVQVAEIVTDEAYRDPRFADSLGRAAAHAGIFIQGPGATYQRNTYDSRGDFRNINVTGARNVKLKKYHIGNIRFGTGGLAAAVFGLVVLAGGGTAAVVTATGESADLASAVGSWAQQPGQQTMPGWTLGPIQLTISADGNFTFSMQAKLSVPDAGGQTGMPPGFGDINLDCGGTVTPDGDHFTLRTTRGSCGTFEAKLGPDGNVIDVFITDSSVDGSLALSKLAQ